MKSRIFGTQDSFIFSVWKWKFSQRLCFVYILISTARKITLQKNPLPSPGFCVGKSTPGWLARPHLHSPVSSVDLASSPVAPHHKNHLELGSAREFARAERLSAVVTVSSSRGGQNTCIDGEE